MNSKSHYRIYKQSFLRLALSSLGILTIISSLTILPNLVFAHVGIPSTPTTSCGSIDSTDFVTHVTSQMDTRISGVASSGAMQMFSTKGDSVTSTGTTSTAWVRNTGVWSSVGSDVDWTGVSPWNQPFDGYSSRYQKSGALISPRHVVLASHWHMPIGSNLLFVTNTDEMIYRTLSGLQSVPGTDITIGVLDSDVPDSVTYYPIIASSTLQALIKKFEPMGNYDIPMVVFDQEKKAIVHSLSSISASTIGHTPYFSGPRSFLSEYIVSGDSGSPAFIVVDDRPILLFAHYSASGGPNLGNYISQINTAMTTLGGGYQVTQYDPTCFTQYTPNNIPVFTSGAVASSTLVQQNPSTVIYTYAATDADVGQTLSYTMSSLSSVSSSTLSLTPSTYFSLSTSTGQLRQIADFDNSIVGNSLVLTVTATDNGTPTSTKQVSTVFNIDYPRIISSARSSSTIELTFSNTLDESSVPSTSDFVLQVNGVNRTVLSTQVQGSYVLLQASPPISIGDSITVRYTPGTNKIKDTLGAYASAITQALSVPNSHAGDLDTSFAPGTGISSVYVYSGAESMAISNGKIIVTGDFDAFNGASTTDIVSINTDGTQDLTFDAGTGSNTNIAEVIGVANNKILIGGSFTTYNGSTSNGVARINADGSLDSTFSVGTGPNAGISALCEAPDGKLYVGGEYITFNGVTISGIIRLNTDGSRDTSFAPVSGITAHGGGGRQVHSCQIQSDGKVLLGGYFAGYDGHISNSIVRVNSDGSFDATFNSPAGLSDYVLDIRGIGLLPDGRIVIGGLASYIELTSAVILNSDGSIDTVFSNPPEFDVVVDILVQPDGKFLFLGSYYNSNHIGIIRFNTDGTIDQTFTPTPGFTTSSGYPAKIVLDSEGDIYVAGIFSHYNGIARPGITKIIGVSDADTVAPQISNITSSTSNGIKVVDNTVSIQAVFTEEVLVTGTPTLELETGTTDRQATYASGSGTDTLTFTYTVQEGDSTSDLDYTNLNALVLAGGSIYDAASNTASLYLPPPGSAGSLGYNKSIEVHSSVPSMFSASIIGNTITLVFDEDLGESSVPATSDFVILRNGSLATIQSVSVSGETVTLVLSNTVVTSDELTISYTPGTNKIMDTSGNEALAFSAQTIVNNTVFIPTSGGGGSGGGGSGGGSSGGGSGGGSAIIYYPNQNTTGATTTVATTTLSTNALAQLATQLTVKEVQQFLNGRGFPVALTGAGSPGKETNFFGSLTKKALIKYQKSRSLAQTGILDTATRLFIVKERSINTQTPTQKPAITKPVAATVSKNLACSASINATPKTFIRYGVRNLVADVKLLEIFLNTYEGLSLPVDGVYSLSDKDAVTLWQEKYAKDILTPIGLKKGTGQVSTQSLNKIRQIISGEVCR